MSSFLVSWDELEVEFIIVFVLSYMQIVLRLASMSLDTFGTLICNFTGHNYPLPHNRSTALRLIASANGVDHVLYRIANFGAQCPDIARRSQGPIIATYQARNQVCGVYSALTVGVM
jgi:hypothetical protein